LGIYDLILSVNADCYVIVANCLIEVQSYVLNGGFNAFVKLNHNTVWIRSYFRGVHVIVLTERLRCTVQQSRSFDTYASQDEAVHLSTYLQQVSVVRQYVFTFFSKCKNATYNVFFRSVVSKKC